MKGRRGFLSGVTKMGALGGAALLLPREALSNVQKAGLGDHADQDPIVCDRRNVNSAVDLHKPKLPQVFSHLLV